MKTKIIELIKKYNDLAFTAFKHHLPEIEGDYDMIFPAKNVEDSKILMISKVSKEFIEIMYDLINNEILSFSGTNFLVVSMDNGEIYNLPIATKNGFKKGYKKLHWLPLLITKGKKFPNHKSQIVNQKS